MVYKLKNIEKMMGREGMAFSANLYCDNKKIAFVRDDGNGGSLSIDYISSDVRDEQRVALTVWHKENCQQDYSRAYPSDDESAINLLYSFQQNDKLAKTSLIYQTGPDLSSMSDEDVTKYINSGKHFDEMKEYRIAGASLNDVGLLNKITSEEPTARIWDSGAQRYRAISDLVNA